MQQPKKPRQSKTYWWNLLNLISAIAAVIAGSEFVQEYPRVAASATAVITAVNLILRFKTSEPIERPKWPWQRGPK